MQNIYGVVGLGTNPAQFKANGTRITAYSHNEISCDAYNDAGVCDAWWYSETYGSAFTLNNFNQMNTNYGQAMNDLFHNNLTTGELFFETACACALKGSSRFSGNLTVTSEGLQAQCLSGLRVLTWDMTCHAKDSPKNDECEFLEQEKQPGFWYRGGQFFNGEPRFSVPAGYLGPALTNGIPLQRD